MVKLSKDLLDIGTSMPSMVREVTRFILSPEIITSSPIEGVLSE